MEFEKSKTTYTLPHKEISSKLEVCAEIVGDISDDLQAAAYIEALNSDLNEARFIGTSVQLTSLTLVWMKEYIEDGAAAIEPVFDKKLLQKTKVNGVYMGVGELEINGQRTLVHELSADFDIQTMSSFTVYAPVDDSRLLVESEDSDSMTLSRRMADNFELLGTIKEETFQEVLSSLRDAMQQLDHVDADKVREIGGLSTWLLAQDSVQGDRAIRRAVLEIIDEAIDDQLSYTISGQEFHIEKIDGGQKLFIRSHDSISDIHGLTTVNDYDVTDGVIRHEKTIQPAFIVLDENKLEYYIPLRFVTNFSAVEQDRSHFASRERFLAQNPDIFKYTQYE